jgi:hypothetical protein
MCSLLFSLVLYYDIEVPLSDTNPYKLTRPDANTLLLEWLNEKLPKDITVKDFSNDWTNGISLAALLCCLSDGGKLLRKKLILIVDPSSSGGSRGGGGESRPFS